MKTGTDELYRWLLKNGAEQDIKGLPTLYPVTVTLVDFVQRDRRLTNGTFVKCQVKLQGENTLLCDNALRKTGFTFKVEVTESERLGECVMVQGPRFRAKFSIGKDQ